MICTTWSRGKDKKGRPVSEISNLVPSFVTGNECGQS